MLKKMNYPLQNQVTGPILKPTVYADNNDTLGNSLLTVNEIYEGNYSYQFFLATAVLLQPSGSPTMGNFVIGGITFTLTNARILRYNFPGSYEGAYDYIELTATTAGSTKLKAAIEASTLRQTMGVRTNTEDGEERDWYPETAGSGSLFEWKAAVYLAAGTDVNNMMVLRLQDAGVIAEIVTDGVVWGDTATGLQTSDSLTISLLT